MKSVLHCLDGSKEMFDSEEIKKVLREYLMSCGYKRSKNLLLLALCIAIPVIITILIVLIVIISLMNDSKFVNTNGLENFSLTEITRDEILSKDNNYRSFMVSERHSGHHTNISRTRLRDCDYDYISRSFGKIHGVVILQATKVSVNIITLNIKSYV